MTRYEWVGCTTECLWEVFDKGETEDEIVVGFDHTRPLAAWAQGMRLIIRYDPGMTDTGMLDLGVICYLAGDLKVEVDPETGVPL